MRAAVSLDDFLPKELHSCHAIIWTRYGGKGARFSMAPYELDFIAGTIIGRTGRSKFHTLAHSTSLCKPVAHYKQQAEGHRSTYPNSKKGPRF